MHSLTTGPQSTFQTGLRQAVSPDRDHSLNAAYTAKLRFCTVLGNRADAQTYGRRAGDLHREARRGPALLTLIYSSQCVPSTLESHRASSMEGYAISFSLRRDSLITWMLWISKNTSSALG